MKAKKSRRVILMFVTVILLGMGTLLFAAQTETEKGKAGDLKEKTNEAVQAIKKYSADQRDEAVKKAKEVLEDLDAQIDHLEKDLNKKWDQMDQKARQKTLEALTALRKKRNTVAEWYGGLKQSSTKAWEEVKQGFVKSYQDLREAFQKAKGAF